MKTWEDLEPAQAHDREGWREQDVMCATCLTRTSSEIAVV